MSQLFSQTLRNAPSEAEVVSHQLLVRAGFIRQLGAGIYSYLPLAKRALTKIENIMRSEMNRMIEDARREIGLAFRLAKKRFKEQKITNITKIRNGMRNINTETLIVRGAESSEYQKTKKQKGIYTRVLVNDETGNEGVVYLFEDRGVILDRTYQLNVGGNMDFKNMLERERLMSKKISKTQSVTSNLHDGPLAGKKEDRNVHIGPSDYVAWLDDRKWAYVRLEGRAFGEVPLNLEYKLEVWDSPNSAGIIIDALRAAKIAKDRGVGGPIHAAATYFMKSPPIQMEDTEGRERLEKFIRGEIER